MSKLVLKTSKLIEKAKYGKLKSKNSLKPSKNTRKHQRMLNFYREWQKIQLVVKHCIEWLKSQWILKN